MSSPTEGSADGKPLLPPGWQELAPLVDTVLDAPAADRPALILELSAGNSAHRQVLERLVAECELAAPLLDRVATERFDCLLNETPASLLPELLGDRYRVSRELGSGGMARVYLARDLKHQRDVAIKVIRPELSASLGHDRFLREIGIAARLRHPNIVPLYDSGEVDGALYFVMPYEEGPSLRERIAEQGPLGLADALNVLRDVARALAYAHEHGVVHRDVKPDNVMLSGGAAVVTDFGIAKAVSAALTDASAPTLTQSGSAIGTPAYMAPEQATGDPSTDHRADIYSFGCLAYELFAGAPPFPNQSMHLVIAAHLTTAPRLVTELRPDVPPAVAELIAHCLLKDPGARPQSARDLMTALDAVATTGASRRADTVGKRRPALRLLGGGVALAGALVATAGYLATRGPGASGPITLTVLPFGNISADSAVEFVAQELGDQVASALSRYPGIQIRSRSGARRYRGQLGVDVAEAGARLKADYVMTGVVRQQEGRWILSANVERAADATSLWAETFDRGPDQVAGAAEAIAATLVTSLRNMFPQTIGKAGALAPNQRTSNNEAYRLYLRAQDRLTRRGQSAVQIAQLFREAIHLDTTYALAYSGLSMALALFPYFNQAFTDEVHDGLVGAARRAIALDSTLPQPHIALALAHQATYQWDQGDAEFLTALRLDGRNVEARVQYGKHQLFRGRLGDGLRQLRMAREEDPASALVLSWLSYAYYLNKQLDSALVESRRALQNDPVNATSLGLGAIVLLADNRPDSARSLISRAARTLPATAYVYAKSGDTTTAREQLRDLDAQSPQPWLAETRRAYLYLGLGDTAKALTALERAVDGREVWTSTHGAYSPIYAPIFNSPRFQALLKRVGLTH